MATRKLTVGVVQQRCGERRDENLAASVAAIREAARRGARLVLLPELHALRYFCQSEDDAISCHAALLVQLSPLNRHASIRDMTTSLFLRRTKSVQQVRCLGYLFAGAENSMRSVRGCLQRI